ncbi:hypothetical protein G4B88_023143 [Cannabis sativa]|uniref:Uncharacterized protein n=1 Tax=Cannabis sativa TaxID=3483 RepID=A0A7J6G6J6_CANSA|nr:hypothetical protein G4B88_023143 [Cannabis sativa]
MGRTTGQDGRITRRSELICVVVGCFFFQLANWVIHYFASPSRDPLFVNTSVSLLHSTIISSSVIFILMNQWLITRGSSSGRVFMFDHSQLFS